MIKTKPPTKQKKEPILCYVDGDSAYFTTQNLEDQWGDDWNDAPYEHNAGTPYGLHSQEKWKIHVLKFDWDAEQPSDGHSNSPYSVEQINSGVVPWLRPSRWVKGGQNVYAGISMNDFCKIIVGSGGKVYRELFEGDELYRSVSAPTTSQKKGEEWEEARDLVRLIPEDIDIIYSNTGRPLCSRQAISNLIATQKEELVKAIEGLSNSSGDVASREAPEEEPYFIAGYNQALQDILDLLDKDKGDSK